MDANKVICIGWIGRFGNRCHSYLYGKHIEKKFGSKFYVPRSGWDGEVIFANPPPKYDADLSSNGFIYAGGSIEEESEFIKNKKSIDVYNKKTGDNIEFIDPCVSDTYGKKNIAYTSLVTDADWFFREIKMSDIKEFFAFSDELKQTDMFKRFEDKQGTYDVAHFRRTDISRPQYKGGHSMVSRQSYHTAFKKFDVDETKVVWISDEPDFGYDYEYKIPTINGRRISWLPDFLKLVFSRNMFRSNSSFSVWAGWIGNSTIFSPWLDEYCPGKEKDFNFVEGNHPHWMAVKGVHSCYQFNINNDLKETKKMNKTKPNNIVIKSSPKKEKGKLIMVHWNGRFGNRVFSYMYGRSYAKKGGLDFYIPSEWEGTRLFKDTGYKIIEDDELRLAVNQTHPDFDNIDARGDAVAEYSKRNNTNLRYVNADHAREFGSPNRWFDSLCVHSCEVFKMFSEKEMLKWFEFTDEIKNLDIYKRLEDKQGTYDIAHLRRDDISCPQYNKNNPQNYSVISKNSYLKTFDKFGFDPNKVEWTTDDWSGKWGVGKPEHKSAGWTYPVGSHEVPDIIFDWLPDFLRLYFARTIFRANSSFSWVAAFLSPTADVYSPVLSTRKIYKGERDEVEYEFVKGNHPHWFNYQGHSCSEITFSP